MKMRIGYVFALLLLGVLQGSPAYGSNLREWLFEGRGVRLVSFQVDATQPGVKDIFIPGQRSGYVLLDEKTFSISVASPFDATYINFQDSALKTETTGKDKKASVPQPSYRAALIRAMDDNLLPGIEQLISKILSGELRGQPQKPYELVGIGYTLTATFGQSYSELKEIAILIPDPHRPGTSAKHICSFHVIPLPSSD